MILTDFISGEEFQLYKKNIFKIFVFIKKYISNTKIYFFTFNKNFDTTCNIVEKNYLVIPKIKLHIMEQNTFAFFSFLFLEKQRTVQV